VIFVEIMTVLIISDEAEFARNVVNRWNMERTVPTFALVSSAVWKDGSGEFDVAVVAPNAASKPGLLKSLDAGASPVICVVGDAAHALKEECPRVTVLRQHEGWLDALVLLSCEALRRVEAGARAARAEEAQAAANRYATLGRYMLEMRHSMNNALTSVLGHTELLLLEPGALSAEVRDQIDTVHSMALRMHEIMQRLSSLDTEMQCAEKQAQHDGKARYVCG
jgi:signal transduction histidine kinase